VQEQRTDDLRPRAQEWSQPQTALVALTDNSGPVTVLAFDLKAWLACKDMGVGYAMNNPGQENELMGMPDNELAQRLVRNQMETMHLTNAVTSVGALPFSTPTVASPHMLMRATLRGNCMVCGKKSPLRCQGCKVVGFCSVECQRKGWKDHKGTCASIARTFGGSMSTKSQTSADGTVEYVVAWT